MSKNAFKSTFYPPVIDTAKPELKLPKLKIKLKKLKKHQLHNRLLN